MIAREPYRVIVGGSDEQAEVTVWLSEDEAALVEYLEDLTFLEVAGIAISGAE